MIYPKALEDLILYFKKLPGIGEKSAERLALSVVNFTEEDNESFSEAIKSIPRSLRKCSTCYHLTDHEYCNICSNEYRNKKLICVVEDYKSIFLFEKIGKFSGVYHVLDGLISPIDGINPEDININSLISRVKNTESDIEIILALKPSIEGEATSMYISKVLSSSKIKISRLSYGIPMGAEIDYLDALTIERALNDRQIIS